MNSKKNISPNFTRDSGIVQDLCVCVVQIFSFIYEKYTPILYN